jgi:hypothetical protein
VIAFILALMAFLYDQRGIPMLIVRENELGRYDTTHIIVSCVIRSDRQTVYVRTIDGTEYWLHEPKERLAKDETRRTRQTVPSQ